MKKVLLLGDYTTAPYHPLTDVDKEISSILGDAYQVDYSDQFDALLTLDQYDLFISYTDCWESVIDDAQTASLLCFCASGKPVLMIHNGISLGNRPEICQMAGGKFVTHPPICDLTINTVLEHPITAGVTSFDVFDEPYRFELEPSANRTVVMEYSYDGVIYPACWYKQFGKGQLAFLMVGHTAKHFTIPAYRTIIKNTADWLCQ